MSGASPRKAAAKLAHHHLLAPRSLRRDSLAPQLKALENRLQRLYERLATGEDEPISEQAAEWLLDNRHTVDLAVAEVRQALPAGFWRRLPRLAEDGAEPAGIPRIEALVRAFFTASPELDLTRLEEFLDAYQDVSPLTLGELWACPALLRYRLLEGLATAVEEGAPEDVVTSLASLRTLERTDWRSVFERSSRVEAELAGDPAGAYSAMDFASRDAYRKAVEEIADGSPHSEPEVARAAVEAGGHGSDPRRRHVGFHLVGEGRRDLERRLGCRPPWRLRWRRGLLAHSRLVYLGGVGLGLVLALSVVWLYASRAGAGWGSLALVMLLGALPACAVAVAALNTLLAWVLPPRTLPRLDFENEGIPPPWATLVAVPCLLTSPEEVSSLVDSLEIHFLANDDPHLGFALLSDWADAPAEEMPGDEELLERAREGIRKLNRRHGTANRKPFLWLHRERRWSPTQGCWMGWERKRGKLEELFRLIQGDGDTTYRWMNVSPEELTRFRFVLTLDADTVLPRGAAARLVATLAHPLQRPRLEGGRVTSGYGILQPRVEILPADAHRTRFARIFAGDATFDAYSRAVSDVYQDLFGRGVFTGKGLLDVEAFHAALTGRVPEGSLLSHDLFESLYARCALVSDALLFEHHPRHALTYLQRLHRWIRGDWQLLPWLGWRVPRRGGERAPAQLSLFDRWLILDNLRRSLGGPTLWLILAAGWLVLPGAPWVWTVLGLATLVVPPILGGARASWLAIRRPFRRTSTEELHRIGNGLLRGLMALVLLPAEIVVSVGAIGRTLLRLAVTRRRLLEWTSDAHQARRLGERPSILQVGYHLGGGMLLSLALTVAVVAFAPEALPAAAPVLLLWLLSPGIVAWTARPAPDRRQPPSPSERLRLRRLARRTWYFFEDMVGPEDHWLPPDNYQEEPATQIAHRTSPTNVGFLLLSTLAAYDLGYLTPETAAARLGNTFDTLNRLPRYRGHLLNWYDTRSLEPLEPRYVSTVDSGNLAAALVSVTQGCEEIAAGPILPPSLADGFGDLLGLLEEALDRRTSGVDGDLAADLDALRATVRGARRAADWGDVLPELEGHIAGLEARITTWLGTEESRAVSPEVSPWLERLGHHLDVVRRSLETLTPWLAPDRRYPGLESLPGNPALDDVPSLCRRAAALLEGSGTPEQRRVFEEAEARAEQVLRDLSTVAWRVDRWLGEMDFGFLYDRQRHLFRIGYDVSNDAPDPNHYDLLASEARLTSFLAIALGQVPQRHWFQLGRPWTRVGGRPAILSWGGTAFEYLMPPLLLREPRGTPLEVSRRAVVARQIAFSRSRKLPWGISESGYHQVDAHGVYQYRAFGVPGIGLRQDLGDRLVIAPYASVLALPVDSQRVMHNFERLKKLGLLGRYGLREAVDFGPGDTGGTLAPKVVRSYMAHHQGMILAALDNHLRHEPLVRRFHSHPRVATTELLLWEQAPRGVRVREPVTPETRSEPPTRGQAPVTSWPVEVGPDRWPRIQLLGNGRYSVLLSDRGSGSSRWRHMALTRWSADPTREAWGTWLYVEEPDRNDLWSVGLEPVPGAGECRVRFAPHQADLFRTHEGVAAHMTVFVPPHDDVEIRWLRLTHRGNRPRRLSLVSCGEVALAQASADRRHPAFSKLFVESRWVPDQRALLFRRRPRDADEEPLWLAHALVGTPEPVGELQWETDRRRFLGRGGGYRRPAALDPGSGTGRLSGTTGHSLDPIFALRVPCHLEPDSDLEIAFVTAVGRSRREVLGLVERCRGLRRLQAALDETRFHTRSELRRVGVSPEEERVVHELLSALIHPHPALRDADALSANDRGQAALWAHGISGDRPILLLKARTGERPDLVRTVLRGHAYWRSRGVEVDLVLADVGASSYDDPLKDHLHRELDRTGGLIWLGRPGGIFLLRSGQLTVEDRTLLAAVARVALDTSRGDLHHQLARLAEEAERLPLFESPAPRVPPEPTPPVEPPSDLRLRNEYGGFSPDGREYVLYLEPDRLPPAPWSQVVAQPDFGFLVTESGGGFTWSLNSGENRLTPWRNDPVGDPPGEVLYLRDEETGEIWTPTPRPAGAPTPYQVRYGAGVATFQSRSHELEQTLELYVAWREPVKILRLAVKNLNPRPRRITVTFYVEWVLGTHRHTTAPHLVQELEAEAGALLVRNPFVPDFGHRVAFVAASRSLHGWTTDRSEFLGRDGDLSRPAALLRMGPASTLRPGVDPCGVVQVHLDLPAHGEENLHFLLGQENDREQALALVRRLRDPAVVEERRRQVQVEWDRLLGSLTVSTPEPEIDLLTNRWLLYQAVSCRLWGRSALYQSSGAFGFRDQLQDVTALLHAAPELVREHLLEAARHQFEAGDVLHWWHPPGGRGIRSRCSDDLLWLPFVAARYVEATGDRSILKEPVPWRTGPELEPDQAERYDRYPPDGEASLVEHCRRALERGLTSGPRGLPLIGSGDWNDGMNRVGHEGRGESVWMAWFLLTVLEHWIAVEEDLGATDRLARLREAAETLRRAVETAGWDGAWYRRAFYDDGTPLGSKDSDGRIDLIAQAWSVLSGAGDREHSREALASAWERLVQEDEGLALLLSPPFEPGPPDPGYIQGYPPGVRENGGQYTHAAIWAAWAYALRGEADRAATLLRMILPTYRGTSPEAVERYRVEPYAVAADVYGVEPHVGLGGWTWYTGSAAWAHRLVTEAILGLRRRVGGFVIDPCLPPSWPGYEVVIREGNATWRIRVDNPEGASCGIRGARFDGRELSVEESPFFLSMTDDGEEHEVVLRLGGRDRPTWSPL